MKLLYYVILSFWYVFSLLPMRIHYVNSYFLYLLVYRLMQYRKKVVRKNLKESFPEKDEAELRRIEQGFYHFFCDYLVESVKLMTISKKNMMKRMKFKGTEQLEEAIRDGQSCAIYLGHLCNWEWVTSLPLWITPEAHCGQIFSAPAPKTGSRVYRHAGYLAQGGGVPPQEHACGHWIHL